MLNICDSRVLRSRSIKKNKHFFHLHSNSKATAFPISNHIQELGLYMENLTSQYRKNRRALTKNRLRSSYIADYSGADQQGELDKTRQTPSLILISEVSEKLTSNKTMPNYSLVAIHTDIFLNFLIKMS